MKLRIKDFGLHGVIELLTKQVVWDDDSVNNLTYFPSVKHWICDEDNRAFPGNKKKVDLSKWMYATHLITNDTKLNFGERDEWNLIKLNY